MPKSQKTTDPREARRQRLIAIMDKLPGANVEKVRWVASAAEVAEYTVRAWLCNSLTRVPTERTLKLVDRAYKASTQQDPNQTQLQL